jgi:hypothetical protein
LPSCAQSAFVGAAAADEVAVAMALAGPADVGVVLEVVGDGVVGVGVVGDGESVEQAASVPSAPATSTPRRLTLVTRSR